MLVVQKYEPPSGDIAQQIEKDFGSLDKLVAEFNPKTAAIQVRPCLPACLPQLAGQLHKCTGSYLLCFHELLWHIFP